MINELTSIGKDSPFLGLVNGRENSTLAITSGSNRGIDRLVSNVLSDSVDLLF